MRRLRWPRYKSLAHAERAFRNLKTVEHRRAPHLPLTARTGCGRTCSSACWLPTWHGTLNVLCAPLLFRDEAPPERIDPVAPPVRSEAARRKENHHRTADDELPVSSLPTLLCHLATLAENRIAPRGAPESQSYVQLTIPTPLQARAFELLGFTPASV